MTNTLVPHEIAVKLKEKGFDLPCAYYYDSDGKRNSYSRNNAVFQDFNNRMGYEDCFSAPDIYQAAAWLRSKGLHIVAVVVDGGGSWVSEVQDIATGNYIEPAFLRPDHDTSYIAGIENALKLVK